MLNDNKTAHMASMYDEKVKATIPNYDYFHSETINLVEAINPDPPKWLDTGCGTGTFSILATNVFRNTEFVLADPSLEMLEIAKKKSTKEDFNIKVLDPISTQEIGIMDNFFDVITAIQVHHYLDRETRKAATENCFRMLKNEGVYITFENTRPSSDKGIKIAIERWKRFQISTGKSVEETEKHAERFDREYFPITVEEHLKLLKEIGFSIAEVFWISYMQAGFYAIKENKGLQS